MAKAARRDEAVAFADRILELENVVLGGRQRPRRLGGTRAPGGTRRRTAVLGYHPFDGGEYVLHRGFLINIPHIEGLIAQFEGGVTGVFGGPATVRVETARGAA